MRLPVLLFFALAAACNGSDEPAGAAERSLPVLEVRRVPRGAIVTDGSVAEKHWQRFPGVSVPLRGPGPQEVLLNAAHDGERFYLLARWKDAERSLNRYWRYLGKLKWDKFLGEDAFSIWWSPGELADTFRAQGCAMFCHDGQQHRYTEANRGFADVWYWGSQTCAVFLQARDMRLPFGANQRLRGDGQPADSDNIPNINQAADGPRYWPTKIDASTSRLMVRGNVAEVTPERMRKYMNDASNVGREIPLDILQARKGSRGDVAYAARFFRGTGYVLELSRALRTGRGDDIVLDPDPLVPYLFAVAVHDGSAGAAHGVSDPVELRFLLEE